MEVCTVAAFRIHDGSAVSEARRAAAGLAAKLAFQEPDAGKVALIVTELSTNLLRHAGGGELILNQLGSGSGRAGIGILTLDKGPGIENVGEALRDGYSTAGGAGTGLGAVRRLATALDIYSSETGTAVFTEVWTGAGGAPPASSGVDAGCVSLTMPGEQANGDACVIRADGSRVRCIIADGLGHGHDAAQASSAALASFLNNPELSPGPAIALMHSALRATRGAAIAVAQIDSSRREVCFAGVGNIGGVIISPGRDHNMVSHNGTVGHEMRKIQEFQYPWVAGSVMLLNSDGVSTRRRPGHLQALFSRPATLIAGVIYRCGARERDDATVVVVKDLSAGLEP